MIVSEVNINARAAPPGPKSEVGKPDDGQSFQESLDNRIQDDQDSRNRAIAKQNKAKKADDESQEHAEEKKPESPATVPTPVVNSTPVIVIPLINLQVQATSGESLGEAGQAGQAVFPVQNSMVNLGEGKSNNTTEADS